MLHQRRLALAALVLLSFTLLLICLPHASPPSTHLPIFACPPPYTSHAALAPSLAVCEAALRPALPPPGTPDLVHAPDVTTLRRPAVVLADVVLCSSPPSQSVVVSAHNAERLLLPNVGALLAATFGLWELIIVLDGCTDGSADAALAAFASRNASSLMRFRLVDQPTSVWEASSDNIGMRLAHPDASHIVLVQADMRVVESGWNVRLALPTSLFADVWAASARSAHNAAAGRFEGNATVPRSLDLPPTREQLDAAKAVFSIRDAINRGPIAMRADVLRQLGRVGVSLVYPARKYVPCGLVSLAHFSPQLPQRARLPHPEGRARADAARVPGGGREVRQVRRRVRECAARVAGAASRFKSSPARPPPRVIVYQCPRAMGPAGQKGAGRRAAPGSGYIFSTGCSAGGEAEERRPPLRWARCRTGTRSGRCQGGGWARRSQPRRRRRGRAAKA